MQLSACHCCGQIQQLPAVPEGHAAHCARCDSRMPAPGKGLEAHRRRTAWVRAWACSALALYPVALTIPFLRLETFGRVRESSILEGALGLWGDGQRFVGAVVFLASVVLPALKLMGILALTWPTAPQHRWARSLVLRGVEWTGRWGMLDVLLIAVLVAWLKVGDLVDVQAGPGTLAFMTMVLASLISSALFDPHSGWESHEDTAHC